jgi:hypothetical protein
MYSYLSVPVDVDLFVYTPKELERMGDRPFIRRVLERGEVLYKGEPA